MNNEYLHAKVNLCLDQAEQEIKELELERALKNLKRANLALSRIFNLEEEGESE